MIVYILFFSAILWLFAVYKVFILDESRDTNNRVIIPSPLKVIPHEKSLPKKLPSSLEASRKIHFERKAETPIAFELSISEKPPIKSQSSQIQIKEIQKPPTSIKIYSSKSETVQKELNSFKSEKISSTQVNNADKIMSWPPLNFDGSIPESDGFDIMPIIDLKVPKFWVPPKDVDLNKVGAKVNGLETIFIMIASYRDFQCRETITSAFNRADHPERLFIAAVDQVIPGDIGCLDIEIPCSEKPDQPICKYRNQISVFKVDAKFSTGPVTARHIGYRLYRGEYYFMQMDAHCQFVRHWDTLIINQWKSTQNEMAVLSSYLSDVQGSLTPEGDSTRNTRPIMCNSDFEGAFPARYLRHGAQPEDYAEVRDMPQLQPFWAAGFSFSRAHFIIRVPYDAYQPMVFQGEEIAIGIRGFTYGYDFYAPRDSVVFHEYADLSPRRKKVHMFWENSALHAGEGMKSLRRATSVIGMAPDIDPSTWDHRELDRYGLGTVRNVSLFYKLFLIDVKERKAVQLCPFVRPGHMHKDFQKFLKPDHLGIDYKNLENYDTKAKLDALNDKQYKFWTKRIKEAMNSKNKNALNDALNNANRIGLNNKDPELIKDAYTVLSTL